MDGLDWDFVSGRNDPRQRYRLYRRHYTEEKPKLLVSCESEEDMGFAIFRMSEEGQLDNALIGIYDCTPDEGKKHWIVLPWLPKEHARTLVHTFPEDGDEELKLADDG